ncbi:MAG: OmpA family protein [Bacteroidia bacterium]|nr:OmpA family protein [Bacteroidia bacterium]
MTSNRLKWLPAWILVCVLVSPLLIQAQSGVEKNLKKARLAAQSFNLVAAEELYQQVLNEDPNNFEAAYQLGRINNYFKKYEESLRWYRKASEIAPDRNDTLYLQIGLAYKILGNYRKSRETLQDFQKRHKVRDEYYERAELEIKGCDIAEAALAGQPSHRVKPASFNSAAGDRFPTYFDQRQEDKYLTFASERPLAKGKSKTNIVTGEPKDSDIYLVVRENDSVFGTEVVPFPKKLINTKGNDGPASFTGDGLTMYFTVCNGKDNPDGCSIYESRYNPVKKQWGKAVFVEALAGKKEVVINSRGKTKMVNTDDRQPYVTPDGRSLFFVSNRPGGKGGFDVWFSRKTGAGWSTPENVQVLNSPFNEATPMVNSTGNKLYFASEGLGGFGGFDLYAAEGAVGNWGEPVNLGAPLNSSYNDLGGYWMPGDSVLYFTSDRTGGVGSYDIYYGRAIYYAPEPLEIAVKGMVRNKVTKQPVEFATVILFEYRDATTIVALDTFYTDQTARYEFPLEAEKKYKVLGNAPQYFANEEEVSTVGITDDKEIVKNIDIELDPITINEAIVLQNIYYDFDEYYLRPDAIVELRRLVKILTDDSDIVIQMGSHTDTNGTDAYNKELSENRAKAAVRFLIDNGINPNRLSWYGFGESQPMIFPEMNDADEQANRRTEFRITSINFN